MTSCKDKSIFLRASTEDIFGQKKTHRGLIIYIKIPKQFLKSRQNNSRHQFLFCAHLSKKHYQNMYFTFLTQCRKILPGPAGNFMFFGPQMALAYRLDAISQGPIKLSISRAQPPLTCPHNVSARIKNITHGAV